MRQFDFMNYSKKIFHGSSQLFFLFFISFFLIRYYLVYEGTSHSYRVPKLKESTSYTFRICARNEVGEGPYSEEVVFTTTRAPPPTLKSKLLLNYKRCFNMLSIHGIDGFVRLYIDVNRTGSFGPDGN